MKTTMSVHKLVCLFYDFAENGKVHFGARYPLGYGYSLVLRQTNAFYMCAIETDDWRETIADSKVMGTGEFADDLTYAINLCYNQFINA